jgi:AraC-like DNA-binding protein
LQKPVGVSPRSQQRTEIEFRLTEAGGVTLLLGGRRQFLPPQRLAVFWAGTPHQVLELNARETWLVRLPLGWVLSRGLPPNFINGLLDGRVFFEPDIDHFECDLHRCRLWSDQGTRRTALLKQAVELEIEARLLRLAATLPDRLPTPAVEPPADEPLRRSLSLAALVARHHTEALSMSELGRLAGLHPNYLMKLFRRELGSSVIEYLTQHRLAHAMRLLVSSPLPLRDVAGRSGFGSIKRLSVTFRESIKDSPAAFRRRHR